MATRQKIDRFTAREVVDALVEKFDIPKQPLMVKFMQAERGQFALDYHYDVEITSRERETYGRRA